MDAFRRETLLIEEYTDLYALFRTTFGGNGRSTFALPDLRGRVPIGTGSNTGGLNQYNLGQFGGATAITLVSGQMPVHNHPAQVSTAQANLHTAQASTSLITPPNQPSGRSSIPTLGFGGTTASLGLTDMNRNTVLQT